MLVPFMLQNRNTIPAEVMPPVDSLVKIPSQQQERVSLTVKSTLHSIVAGVQVTSDRRLVVGSNNSNAPSFTVDVFYSNNKLQARVKLLNNDYSQSPKQTEIQAKAETQLNQKLGEIEIPSLGTNQIYEGLSFFMKCTDTSRGLSNDASYCHFR